MAISNYGKEHHWISSNFCKILLWSSSRNIMYIVAWYRTQTQINADYFFNVLQKLVKLQQSTSKWLLEDIVVVETLTKCHQTGEIKKKIGRYEREVLLQCGEETEKIHTLQNLWNCNSRTHIVIGGTSSLLLLMDKISLIRRNKGQSQWSWRWIRLPPCSWRQDTCVAWHFDPF